ncbi:MAG: hypothetical protein ACFE8O_08685 [Candidatus Hermodarchaeota archaeon]
MSTDCIEPIRHSSGSREDSPHRDIRREKRLLRQAIAASTGPHRIRLQRELAALEDYERDKRQQHPELTMPT